MHVNAVIYNPYTDNLSLIVIMNIMTNYFITVTGKIGCTVVQLLLFSGSTELPLTSFWLQTPCMSKTAPHNFLNTNSSIWPPSELVCAWSIFYVPRYEVEVCLNGSTLSMTHAQRLAVLKLPSEARHAVPLLCLYCTFTVPHCAPATSLPHP